MRQAYDYWQDQPGSPRRSGARAHAKPMQSPKQTRADCNTQRAHANTATPGIRHETHATTHEEPDGRGRLTPGADAGPSETRRRCTHGHAEPYKRERENQGRHHARATRTTRHGHTPRETRQRPRHTRTMKARARCHTPHTDAHTEQRARGGTSNDHSGERPTLSPGSASKHASRTRAKQRTHAATNEARSRQEAPPNTGRATTTPDSKHTHSAHKARRAAETDAERRRLKHTQMDAQRETVTSSRRDAHTNPEPKGTDRGASIPSDARGRPRGAPHTAEMQTAQRPTADCAGTTRAVMTSARLPPRTGRSRQVGRRPAGPLGQPMRRLLDGAP